MATMHSFFLTRALHGHGGTELAYRACGARAGGGACDPAIHAKRALAAEVRGPTSSPGDRWRRARGWGGGALHAERVEGADGLR